MDRDQFPASVKQTSLSSSSLYSVAASSNAQSSSLSLPMDIADIEAALIAEEAERHAQEEAFKKRKKALEEQLEERKKMKSAEDHMEIQARFHQLLGTCYKELGVKNMDKVLEEWNTAMEGMVQKPKEEGGVNLGTRMSDSMWEDYKNTASGWEWNNEKGYFAPDKDAPPRTMTENEKMLCDIRMKGSLPQNHCNNCSKMFVKAGKKKAGVSPLRFCYFKKVSVMGSDGSLTEEWDYASGCANCAYNGSTSTCVFRRGE
ncbi:hypothetical protein BJ508DRAFT_327690 [Ascobolus immersus RN42]|uniref:Uncharacterized protein n=1 Tax=Ascobolus immersus RN42 TaxID=1160509 RepID=A0A3N4I7E3_ASCIM|nr:hypothetical protein BJ508DRAFT_327690 [Ascobolus immersus RN42]